MLLTQRTYFKGWLLLIVFSLNTVVSFACSFSNFFHEVHHQNPSVSTEHKHGGDSQHSHDEKHSDGSLENHHSTVDDHHGAAPSDHHGSEGSGEKAKDDCCSESVVQLDQSDRAVSSTILAPHPVLTTAFLAACITLFASVEEQDTFFPAYLRWRAPTTIHDIRIVIQSFQI